MVAAFAARVSLGSQIASSRSFGNFAGLGTTAALDHRLGTLQLQLRFVASEDPASTARGVLCGHISNFRELTQELHERAPNVPPCNDAISLLDRLYDAYGIPGLRLVHGLCVGALFRAGKVILFASKTAGPSLYYSVEPSTNGVWFGTELKAFPATLRKMRDFAELSRDTAEGLAQRTCLRDVFRVRAGHVVVIDGEKSLVAQEHRYHSMVRSFDFGNEQAAVLRIREVMEGAINAIPGSTANCLISGGLDSSIVAALAQSRFDSVRLYSLGSPERNEFAEAQRLATRFGTTVEKIWIAETDFLRVLPELVYLLEHCHSTFIEYLLPVHLAHERVGGTADVLLSGYGSDVLFAGFAKPGLRLDEVTRLVEEEYASTIWSNEACQTLENQFRMKIRYPFFDSSVVEVALSIDPYLKHKHGIEKYVLRQAFASLLGNEVAFRPKVGVHQGTGSEDYLSAQLGGGSPTTRRLLKDRLCYDILRTLLTDSACPDDIDMHLYLSRIAAPGNCMQVSLEPPGAS